MALFFDQTWFDEALKARGLTREDAARAMGLEEETIAAIWKDQRVMKPEELAMLAQLCGVELEEAAKRAGIGAIEPQTGGDAALLRRMAAEIHEIRQMVAKLLARD